MDFFSCKKTFDKTSKNFKSDIISSKTDKFSYIYKLRGLNDVSISPISKEKTYIPNNNPDVTMFMFMKPMDKIEQPQKKYNLKQETIQNNEDYKPCIMKIIGEIKHMLSKFKERMQGFELRYLKNEILNQYDAEEIVFIIGCTISKLKEELKNQEKLLTIASYQQSIQPISKTYKHDKHDNYDYNNESQSKSKISQSERSLDTETKNWKQNDHVSITPVSHENYRNLPVQNSSISILEANHKIAAWNKRNRDSILNIVSKFKVGKKKNLNTRGANWKHSSPIGPVAVIDNIVPDQFSTRTKQKEVPCMQSKDDDDVIDLCSTCSTVPLFPMKNNNMLKGCKHKNRITHENKNKLRDRLKSSFPYSRSLHICNVSKPQLTNLSSYNLEETIIPQNTKHEMSTFSEQTTSYYSTKRSKMDLEIVSVNSSISSTFSAYIHPSTSYDIKNDNALEINSATTKSNVRTLDRKIFMNCKVILDKLQV